MAKKQRGKPSSSEKPKGFDFGAPFDVVLAGTFDWMRHLHDAGIDGCAYGVHPVPSLNAQIPSISLIARNPEATKAAFEEFHRWSDGSDHDAVELTIVYLDNGGYLLGISPEPDRWIARTTASDVMIDPLMLMSAWVKTMDTTHPHLREFQERQAALIAPFGFDAAHNVNPGGPIVPGLSLANIQGLQPLIKFRCAFFDEKSASQKHTASLVLQMHKQRDRRSGRMRVGRAGPPKWTSKDWTAKRRRVVYQIFPLTLFRVAQTQLIEAVAERLNPVKIARWQVEQAAINLVYSRAICDGKYHYRGLPRKDFQNALVQAARSYTEVADGENNLSDITPDMVIRQIELDAEYLLGASGNTPARGQLQNFQKALERRGFLTDA